LRASAVFLAPSTTLFATDFAPSANFYAPSFTPSTTLFAAFANLSAPF